MDLIPKEINIKRIKRILASIADIAALFMALTYAGFVTVLHLLNLGTMWLNIGMLVITLLYCGFLLCKLFYLNKFEVIKTVKKITKRIYKIVKWGMKGINILFIVLGLFAVAFGPSHILPIIGVVFFIITFWISVIWDIIIYLVSRKVKRTIDQFKPQKKQRELTTSVPQ